MAFDLTPINVKDATGTSKPMIVYNDGTNNAFAHAVVDSTGAIISPATSGLQTTANSTLATIASQTNGVATAANQTTGNTSLASIVTNVGATNDAAASADTGSFSLNALIKRGLANWTTLLARIPALSGGRVPVDGSGITQPVSAASLPLPTGAATAANQATSNSSLASILTAVQEASRPRVQAATATMTRPADTTAYAANDIVANSTTAGSVTPFTIAAARANDQPGQVVRGKLRKSGTTATNGIFRIHLFNISPSVSNGDNGAFAPTATAGWLGSMDVTTSQVFGDGCVGIAVPTLGSGIPFVPAAGTPNIFALIEARAAYTPANAEVFTLELEVA